MQFREGAICGVVVLEVCNGDITNGLDAYKRLSSTVAIFDQCDLFSFVCILNKPALLAADYCNLELLCMPLTSL